MYDFIAHRICISSSESCYVGWSVRIDLLANWGQCVGMDGWEHEGSTWVGWGWEGSVMKEIS